VSQPENTPPRKRRPGIGGRPTKLTPDVARRVCDLIRGGNYPETAAKACGVSRQTLLAWMKEGADIRQRVGDDGIPKLVAHRRALAQFSVDMERAFSEAEARDVLLIGRAAQGDGKRAGDWRAAAFLLERRNRERWSPHTETTATVTTVDATQATARAWVDEKLRRLAEIAASVSVSDRAETDND
jgi:hypothetical protein